MGRRLYSYICYGVDLTGYEYEEAYESLCAEYDVALYFEHPFDAMGYGNLDLMEFALDGKKCTMLYSQSIEYSEFDEKAISIDPLELVATEEEKEALVHICKALNVDVEPQWYLCGSFI